MEQRTNSFSKCYRRAFLTEKKIILVICLQSYSKVMASITSRILKKNRGFCTTSTIILTSAKGTQFFRSIFLHEYFSHILISSSFIELLKKLYIIDWKIFFPKHLICYIFDVTSHSIV